MRKFKLSKLRLSTKILLCMLVFLVSVAATLSIIYRENIFAVNETDSDSDVETTIDPNTPRPPKRLTVEFSRYSSDRDRAKVVVRWQEPTNLSEDCPYVTESGRVISPETQSAYLKWHLNWYGPLNVHYGPKILSYNTLAHEISDSKYIQWGSRNQVILDLYYDVMGEGDKLLGRAEISPIFIPQNYDDPMRLNPTSADDPNSYIENPKLQIERFSDPDRFKLAVSSTKDTSFRRASYVLTSPKGKTTHSGTLPSLAMDNMTKEDTGEYTLQIKNLYNDNVSATYKFQLTDWYPEGSLVTQVNECPGEENCGTITDSPDPGDDDYGGGDSDGPGAAEGDCTEQCYTMQDCKEGNWIVEPICKAFCNMNCFILDVIAGFFNTAFELLQSAVGIS